MGYVTPATIYIISKRVHPISIRKTRAPPITRKHYGVFLSHDKLEKVDMRPPPSNIRGEKPSA